MGLLLKPIEEEALRLAAQGLMSLTSSEYRVLRGLFHGLKSEEIAVETGLTKQTVQFYLKTIFRKCGCDRLTLMKMASRLELNAGVMRHLQSLGMEIEEPRAAIRQVAIADPASDFGMPLAASNGGHSSQEATAGRFFDIRRRPFRPRRSLR